MFVERKSHDRSCDLRYPPPPPPPQRGIAPGWTRAGTDIPTGRGTQSKDSEADVTENEEERRHLDARQITEGPGSMSSVWWQTYILYSLLITVLIQNKWLPVTMSVSRAFWGKISEVLDSLFIIECSIPDQENSFWECHNSFLGSCDHYNRVKHKQPIFLSSTFRHLGLISLLWFGIPRAGPAERPEIHQRGLQSKTKQTIKQTNQPVNLVHAELNILYYTHSSNQTHGQTSRHVIHQTLIQNWRFSGCR